MSPLRGELVAGVDDTTDEWVTSYVKDQLYLEMCEGPLIEHQCEFGCGCRYLHPENFHYIEAAHYASRISSGNFEGKNAKYKPRFVINAENFTPKLKEELKTADKAKALHDIVTESIFRIFEARHRRIFYDHIQPHKLNWDIENL